MTLAAILFNQMNTKSQLLFFLDDNTTRSSYNIAQTLKKFIEQEIVIGHRNLKRAGHTEDEINFTYPLWSKLSTLQKSILSRKHLGRY